MSSLGLYVSSSRYMFENNGFQPLNVFHENEESYEVFFSSEEMESFIVQTKIVIFTTPGIYEYVKHAPTSILGTCTTDTPVGCRVDANQLLSFYKRPINFESEIVRRIMDQFPEKYRDALFTEDMYAHLKKISTSAAIKKSGDYINVSIYVCDLLLDMYYMLKQRNAQTWMCVPFYNAAIKVAEYMNSLFVLGENLGVRMSFSKHEQQTYKTYVRVLKMLEAFRRDFYHSEAIGKFSSRRRFIHMRLSGELYFKEDGPVCKNKDGAISSQKKEMTNILLQYLRTLLVQEDNDSIAAKYYAYNAAVLEVSIGRATGHYNLFRNFPKSEFAMKLKEEFGLDFERYFTKKKQKRAEKLAAKSSEQ